MSISLFFLLSPPLPSSSLSIILVDGVCCLVLWLQASLCSLSPSPTSPNPFPFLPLFSHLYIVCWSFRWPCCCIFVLCMKTSLCICLLFSLSCWVFAVCMIAVHYSFPFSFPFPLFCDTFVYVALWGGDVDWYSVTCLFLLPHSNSMSLCNLEMGVGV